nr:hypothetical protein [uncultured Carboxylicivirga sp.]
MKKIGIILLLMISLIACEKGAGEGGTSKICGKVIVEEYNIDFTYLRATYPAQAYDVYIIYGDEPYFGDKIETNYDGYFEFNYLREGDYTIYVYSKDKTLDYNMTSELTIVERQVSITEKDQEIIVEDMVVVD